MTDRPDQPVIAVRGEAVLEVEPEIAQLTVTITARDADRAKTLRLLNERAIAIDAVLDGFAAAIEKMETSGMRVSPQLKPGKPRERVIGYVGVVQETVTVTAAGFDRLGELVAQLADQDLTDVAGPWWSLRPGSPAHQQARLQAVGDAVQRARDYARAVGSELTDLVELADTGLLGAAADQQVFAAQMARGFAHGAPEELTFDITPVKQTVRATVEARFRSTSPDLTGGKEPVPST